MKCIKLYEYRINFSADIVIAAESEESARQKAESLTPGEIMDKFRSDGGCDSFHGCEIDAPEIRDPDGNDGIECQAHFVCIDEVSK